MLWPLCTRTPLRTPASPARPGEELRPEGTLGLRRALLDYAAECDVAGLPRSAAIATRIATGAPPPPPEPGEDAEEVRALWALVEIFGDDLLRPAG